MNEKANPVINRISPNAITPACRFRWCCGARPPSSILLPSTRFCRFYQVLQGSEPSNEPC